MGDYWGLSARRFLRAIQNGKFRKLLDSSAPEWISFVQRASLIPWNDRVVLCLRKHDDDGTETRVWVVYKLTSRSEEGVSMGLEFIAFPGEDPESWIGRPEDLEGIPTFFHPPVDNSPGSD